jgi:hypothetical protein
MHMRQEHYQVAQPTATSCNAFGYTTTVGAPNLTAISDAPLFRRCLF